MLQQELLKRVVQVLEDLGIPYMITGSVVSSLQGEPRSTHDIDILITIAQEDVSGIVHAFPSPDFYLDEEIVSRAAQDRSIFSLIDVNNGYKVDFWLLTDSPFDQSRFARKQVEVISDLKIEVSSPEDTILMKLYWAFRSGGSEKQFTDALRVFEVQRAVLDLEYLELWAGKLGVQDLWLRIKTEAELLD